MASEFQQQKELYWKIRDDLMKKYKGKWVSIAQNKIVAVAESSTDVLRIAYEKTKTKIMYINKVGEEEKAMRKKIRRYNMEHDPAMPMVDVLISRLDGLRGIESEGIIDTGADTSVLPENSCSELGIYEFQVVDLDLEQVWQDYITLLEAIHEKTAGKTVLSVDIPGWYDESRIKDIAPNLDFFVIMAYDSGGAGWNTASEIEDAVASEMGAIRGEGSKAVIGIGVHEGFEDKGEVEKCVDELYKYYSADSAFSGVSIFKYESYSGLAGAPEASVPTGEEKGIPGFEAVFAVAGLLAVAYLLRRR